MEKERYNEHIKDNKDCYKKRWINKLLLMNKQPILEVVKENLSLSEAFNFEKEYIKNFKNLGVRLTNETIGGEAPMAEKKHKEETKLKMSESRKGEQNSFFGKKHSDETKNKLKVSLKGKKTWNKGKKLTEEHIKNLKIAKVGHVPHNKNKTRFDLSLIEKLLNNGVSQTEVAKMFNTNQGTISRYKKKHKMKINN
jgi:group I intron endonuclease